MNGSPEMVSILLKGGARADLKDNEGLTPLEQAEKGLSLGYLSVRARERYMEVAKILKEHLLKANSRISHGQKWLEKPPSLPEAGK